MKKAISALAALALIVPTAASAASAASKSLSVKEAAVKPARLSTKTDEDKDGGSGFLIAAIVALVVGVGVAVGSSGGNDSR